MIAMRRFLRRGKPPTSHLFRRPFGEQSRIRQVPEWSFELQTQESPGLAGAIQFTAGRKVVALMLLVLIKLKTIFAGQLTAVLFWKRKK